MALIDQELDNAKNRDGESQDVRPLREFVPADNDAEKVSDESSEEPDGYGKTEREAAPVKETASEVERAKEYEHYKHIADFCTEYDRRELEAVINDVYSEDNEVDQALEEEKTVEQNAEVVEKIYCHSDF